MLQTTDGRPELHVQHVLVTLVFDVSFCRRHTQTTKQHTPIQQEARYTADQ